LRFGDRAPGGGDTVEWKFESLLFNHMSEELASTLLLCSSPNPAPTRPIQAADVSSVGGGLKMFSWLSASVGMELEEPVLIGFEKFGEVAESP